MTKTFRSAIATMAAILSSFLLGAAPAAAESWNMPTPYPAGSFHTQNIAQFAEDIATATNGALSITVHPAGSLVKHPEIKNAVRSGQVQIGEFLLSRLSNESAVFEADAVPFLAASYAESHRLWQAQRRHVTELLARQRLTVLYAVPWPPQGLYSARPIATIDDLSGMRFRTYNAATERLAQLAGAVPTQVEVPDIAQAFATGRVEGMITSPTTGVNSKAWDYLSHYYDTQAFLPKNIVVVNTAALEQLPDAQRAAVLDAAARAEERGWKMSEAETELQTRTLGENGIAVAAPGEQLRVALARIGAQMTEEWLARAGDAGTTILADFRKDTDAHSTAESN